MSVVERKSEDEALGMKKKVLYIFNTLIVPFKDDSALFKIEKISVDTAKQIVSDTHGEFVSAVGHPATAQLISLLLGVNVPVNRIQAFLQPGDRAIALVLRQRLPEGMVLNSIDQINQIGYDLYLINRIQ
jgi:hypothetical protein